MHSSELHLILLGNAHTSYFHLITAAGLIMRLQYVMYTWLQLVGSVLSRFIRTR